MMSFINNGHRGVFNFRPWLSVEIQYYSPLFHYSVMCLSSFIVDSKVQNILLNNQKHYNIMIMNYSRWSEITFALLWIVKS